MEDPPSRPNPEFVFHRPPPIEIYQVRGDQLDRIEEDCGQVDHDLTFSIATGSIAITLCATLLTTEASDSVQTIFIVATVVCFLVSLYTGIRWFRRRRSIPKVLQIIRSRQSDNPSSPPDEGQ